MALTRDFRETILAVMRRDSVFRRGILSDELESMPGPARPPVLSFSYGARTFNILDEVAQQFSASGSDIFHSE